MPMRLAFKDMASFSAGVRGAITNLALAWHVVGLNQQTLRSFSALTKRRATALALALALGNFIS